MRDFFFFFFFFSPRLSQILFIFAAWISQCSVMSLPARKVFDLISRLKANSPVVLDDIYWHCVGLMSELVLYLLLKCLLLFRALTHASILLLD